MPDPTASPARRGALLALLAAVAFGLTTPVIERAGAGSSPFATAALLYLGAATAALVLGAVGARGDAPLRASSLPRVALVALLGAAVAPSLLAWGVLRTGAATASLLLNLEAVFTVVLARMFFREAIGPRVAAALGLMLLGGLTLTIGAVRNPALDILGLVAVVGATLAWAADNTLTRPLADVRPLSVVTAKGLVGAALTTTVALLLHQRWPTAGAAIALLVSGATGYGLSLVLYLRAQRAMGAARTGSVFAIGPFVGAALAVALGSRALGWEGVAAAAFFAAGVWLHVTEKHRHRHVHPPLTHEHAHRHDDGHHDHLHDPSVTGEHSHLHHHDELAHEHEHAPDLHHHHEHR